MKHKILFKFDSYLHIAVLLMLLALSAQAQTGDAPNIVASGGAFTLEKAVIAGGGGEMAQQPFSKSGTSGQAVAGTRSTGGNFTLYSGFWTPETLTPTAASVTVGGRVKTADGRGIRNVIVTIQFPTGEQRSVISGASGYYRFADIPAGANYIFSVHAKRHSFSQPTQVRNIVDDVQDIDFVADAPAAAAPPDAIAPQ